MRDRTVILESVDSTNDYLRRLADRGEAADGLIAAAREQTKGKGRQGHDFKSSPGGIYLSMLVSCSERSIEDVMDITAKTAVCIRRALRDACGITAGIKWVNDLILNGKKIGGILVEAAPVKGGRIPFVIIGTGINLNQASFPEEIRGIATSLFLETGRRYSFEDMVEAMGLHLDSLRLRPEDPSYLEEYRQASVLTGQKVAYVRDGVRYEADVLGIDDSFGLVTDLGTLKSGEVSVRGIGGGR